MSEGGTQSTLEEATRCPKCQQPGEVVSTKEAPRDHGLPAGTKYLTVYCRNTDTPTFSSSFSPLSPGARCKWADTCWIVQVNPDGSVPPPQDHSKTPKNYVGFEGHDEEAQRVLNALTWEEQAQRKPGHEMRNPYA